MSLGIEFWDIEEGFDPEYDKECERARLQEEEDNYAAKMDRLHNACTKKIAVLIKWLVVAEPSLKQEFLFIKGRLVSFTNTGTHIAVKPKGLTQITRYENDRVYLHSSTTAKVIRNSIEAYIKGVDNDYNL